MQNQKENLFSKKFSLLNSQEHVEDIRWSSSDSSDVENVTINTKTSTRSNQVDQKRKRRRKTPKNISNLNVTILDTTKELKDATNAQKSPDLRKTCKAKALNKSPIFAPTQVYSRPHKCLKMEASSPILSCKLPAVQPKLNIVEKSPILLLKHGSPKPVSPKVRKKLFNAPYKQKNFRDYAKSETVSDFASKTLESILDRRKGNDFPKNIGAIKSVERNNLDVSQNADLKLNLKSETELFDDNNVILHEEHDLAKVKIEIPDSQEDKSKPSQHLSDLDDSFAMLKTPNTELTRKVKSYFNNHFSSEASQVSQDSISECPTQKSRSKNSEDVEIISIISQVNSKRGSFQSEKSMVSKNPSPVSSQSAEIGMEKLKKIRYKKDGLAYRLNTLVKKQNASISLWQHERFLADNSNFLIPKGEHVVFFIQKVDFKYGSYFLEAIDGNDSTFFILINSVYVQGCSISESMVFKLYEPYKIIDFKENKLIINVCKFECNSF